MTRMLLGTTILSSIIIILFVLITVRKRRENKRGWKISSSGRDMHKYIELYDGKWRSIEIDGEMSSRRVPNHAIYLPSDWSKFPLWAQERKTIIISRLKQELKEPRFTFIEHE